jgi:predicted enzyme related to lactoylglutathione lyase
MKNFSVFIVIILFVFLGSINSEAYAQDPSHSTIKDSAVTTQYNNHRIDYIEFSATDIAATKGFYTAVFGWKFTDYGPDYTSFEDGRISGGFAKAQLISGNGVLVVIYSSELEKTKEAVVRNGGKITKPPFDFPGGRRFHFTDPNGNELAVWSEK